jgi:F0F1-type ATP synthase beta subunit
VLGKLPSTAGYQPALPRIPSVLAQRGATKFSVSFVCFVVNFTAQ